MTNPNGSFSVGEMNFDFGSRRRRSLRSTELASAEVRAAQSRALIPIDTQPPFGGILHGDFNVLDGSKPALTPFDGFLPRPLGTMVHEDFPPMVQQATRGFSDHLPLTVTLSVDGGK